MYNKNIYAPLNIKNGNIEVTKYRQRLDVGKKIIDRSILKIHTLPRVIQDDSVATYYSAKDFEKLEDRKNFRRK